MKEKKSVIKSAVILSGGTFIAKLLGALYRIPLTSLLGGLGLGLYQMVFPVYTVLLDFSGASAPNAIAKVVASSKDKDVGSKKLLRVSLVFFVFLGLIFSLFMAVFSGVLSNAQGDKGAKMSYIALAPAVLFVCILSCFRGYFQGRLKMYPTAISQIIEQIVKLALGLLLVKLFLPNIPLAVCGAVFAITVSEIVAVIYILFVYKKENKNFFPNKDILYGKEDFNKNLKVLLRHAIPVALIGLILPASQVFDSFIIVNILKKYTENATSLYGIYSGACMTIINLPVSICYGISSVAIPYVSSSKTDAEKEKNSLYTLFLTLGASIPCAVFCYFFSPTIVSILFKSLSSFEKQTCIRLLKILSPVIVLLAFLQTSNAVLIGRDKLRFPLISMLFGVSLKIILSFVLINIPSFNIYGSALALIVCYFSADLINLILLRLIGGKYAGARNKTEKLND